MISVQPAEGEPVSLTESIKAANPHVYWVRIVFEFAAPRCSVKGHFLGYDEAFGDHACDVVVDFDPRWEDDAVVVPMSMSATSQFKTFTRRPEDGEDIVETVERSCNVSMPAGTFRFEPIAGGAVRMINADNGEVLLLVPTDVIPSYIYRLPER